MQFMFDFGYILEDYKAGSDNQNKSRYETEISSLKGEKKVVEDRLVSMEDRVAEFAKTNSAFLKQVMSSRNIKKGWRQRSKV